MLPLLASAIADAAGASRDLAGAAFAAGQNPGRGNLAAALASPLTAPFAVAGVASSIPKPANIPDWLWPFPVPPGPNELPTDAMDAGPIVTPGTDPPFRGGQMDGVNYRFQFTRQPSSGPLSTSAVYQCFGPFGGVRATPSSFDGEGLVSGYTFEAFSRGHWQEGGNAPSISVAAWRFIGSRTVSSGDSMAANVILMERVDGQPDTGGDPPGGTEPERAPNPTRRPNEVPRPLPPYEPQPAPGKSPQPQAEPQAEPAPLPWPETAPQTIPDTAPLTPPAPAPNFAPTPTPEPVPATTPGTTPQPSDPEAPRETPPNLSDDPLTPPVTDPLKPVDGSSNKSKGPLSALNNPITPLLVAIPVVVLDGLRQKVNTPSANLMDRTKPNPNVRIVTPPPVATINLPQPSTCIYERQRVMDIQNKATDVQAKASNPVSGFPGLYGLQIEARLKLGQTFTLLEGVNNFMKKAWETTRIQKLLNLLTFVGVMHNVSMLSRDIGETFFYLIAQGLDIVGIDDEEGNALNIQEIVGTTVNNYLISLFGEVFVEGVRDSYRKANRIVQSASMVIWTIRSIQDASLDLMEWVAENTGKIGNALKRFGVVGDRAYPWMSERAQARDRHRARFDKITNALESTEDKLSSYSIATSNVLEIQQETQELGENWGRFKESLNDVPDPWFNNEPVQAQVASEVAASVSPPITAANADNP